MPSCVQCGKHIPKNQGSSVCSMCYGDIDHGKDGYYQMIMNRYGEKQEENNRIERAVEEAMWSSQKTVTE